MKTVLEIAILSALTFAKRVTGLLDAKFSALETRQFDRLVSYGSVRNFKHLAFRSGTPFGEGIRRLIKGDDVNGGQSVARINHT